jgi:uncharacterized membrane protein
MNFESFEDIKVLMDNFDPASLLPDLSTLPGLVATLTRFAVLAGPIVLLIMGILYFFLSPKEANYHFGYRCYFGMGSVEAWRFTQRFAGVFWAVLGLVLTVVMLLITGGYGSKDVSEIIHSGLSCLVWEIILAALSCLVINVTAMILFDRKGLRRRDSWRKV